MVWEESYWDALNDTRTLAFTRNKRTDNAGFGALVLGVFGWRFREATGFVFRFDLVGEVFYFVSSLVSASIEHLP